jgi:hypothetical protein
MKTCNVKIELDIDIDEESSDEDIREAIYEYLIQLIDDDYLDFVVEK